MRKFEYVITDAVGLHARPAGMLVKEVGKYSVEVTLKRGEKEASAKKLLALMSLGIKQNDTVVVEIEGADEEVAAQALESFFKENL
ncbi:HPr family phosphocarrier protein [Lachnospiraceae bacterium OttesenSCG-928-J05]|nr:HPr family phosphocarrier protein [Lachnospiraceae bacterium OttesenSCG-928-J05]